MVVEGKGGAGMSHGKREQEKEEETPAPFNNQLSCELIEWELTHYQEHSTMPFMKDPLPLHTLLPPGPAPNIGDYLSTWDLEGMNIETIFTYKR